MDEIVATRPNTCPDANGTLPACTPLAVPFVPFQQNNPQVYTAAAGIIRGTLYPGLDLPFQNQVNTQEKTATLRHQIQALSFAVDELGLYLDTHRNDKEALQLYTNYVTLAKEGRQRDGRPLADRK